MDLTQADTADTGISSPKWTSRFRETLRRGRHSGVPASPLSTSDHDSPPPSFSRTALRQTSEASDAIPRPTEGGMSSMLTALYDDTALPDNNERPPHNTFTRGSAIDELSKRLREEVAECQRMSDKLTRSIKTRECFTDIVENEVLKRKAALVAYAAIDQLCGLLTRASSDVHDDYEHQKAIWLTSSENDKGGSQVHVKYNKMIGLEWVTLDHVANFPFIPFTDPDIQAAFDEKKGQRRVKEPGRSADEVSSSSARSSARGDQTSEHAEEEAASSFGVRTSSFRVENDYEGENSGLARSAVPKQYPRSECLEEDDNIAQYEIWSKRKELIKAMWRR